MHVKKKSNLEYRMSRSDGYCGLLTSLSSQHHRDITEGSMRNDISVKSESMSRYCL